MTSVWRRPVLFAAPGITLAITGATHPSYLTYTTSEHWLMMHIVGLFVFPLVGVALIGLVQGRSDILAIITVLGAYVYATCYTALDVLSGAGAGYVTYELGPGQLRPDALDSVFQLGHKFEMVGAIGLLVAGVAVSVDAVRRSGRIALLPGLLITVAGVSFLDSHIFWFRGAATVLAIGVATGWFAGLEARRRAARVPSTA